MSGGIGPLARALRSLRAEQGVTQLDLALAMQTDTTYLSKLENGRSRNPGREFLVRYVRGYASLGRPLSEDQKDRLTAALMAPADEPVEVMPPRLDRDALLRLMRS